MAKPGYLVFKKVGSALWELVGDVDRRPGLPARRSRAQAVTDAGGVAGETYVALPRSEWRVASDVEVPKRER